jgi:tRNA A-37 threonylcarbamoyl transferase component Bud32
LSDGDKSKPPETPSAGAGDRQFAETFESEFARGALDTVELGAKLAEFEIVEKDEYRTISDSLGHDTGRILKHLAESGKITNFQRERIAAGSLENIVFDDYVILDQIGAGGMGEVFKARNRQLDRIEAIKTIRTAAEEGSTALQRFRREAHVLAKLEHPSIVPIYKVGAYEGVHYIAMKYVDGEDLRVKAERAAADEQPIPIDVACRWISQAASALGHAHKLNIVHRDIKPGNLMVTREGHLYVLDMGIARLTVATESKGGQLTRQNIAVGTPDFMPPEQWADATGVAPETDIYALGCTLFYVLAGRPPFAGKSMMDLMAAHAGEPPPRVSPYRPDAPEGLDAVIQKMLAKRPEERYRTADEVIAALAPFCDAERALAKTVAKTAEAPGLVGSGRGEGGWKWGALAAVVLAGGIGLGAVLIQSSRDRQGDAPVPVAEAVSKSPGGVGEVAAPEPSSVDPPKPMEPPGPARPAWAAEFLKEHEGVWKDEEEVLDWIVNASGSEGPPESLTPELRAALEAESQVRAEAARRRAVEAAADAYRSERPGVWPDRAELLNQMQVKYGDTPIPADAAAFHEALDEESERLAHPFEGLRVETAKASWEKAWVGSAVQLLKEAAQLQASPRSEDWAFEAAFLDEEFKVVTEARPKDRVTLAYRSDRPAYITIVQWDDQGMISLILRASKPASRQFDGLIESSSFDFPGPKSVVLYATDRPYFTARVERIDGNRVQLKDVFSSPRVFERIERAFQSGEPVPAVPPPSEAVQWTRSTARILIRP